MSSGEPVRRERRGGDDALALGVLELPVLGPGDGARRDAVHAHPRRELERERARERGEPGLGDAVERVALQRPLGVDVDDVDDRALVLRELRRRLLRDEERRAQVGADQLLPVRRLRSRPRRTGKKLEALFTRMSSRPKLLERRADQRARRDRREQLGLHLRGAARAHARSARIRASRRRPRNRGSAAPRSRPRRAAGARSPRRRAARRRSPARLSPGASRPWNVREF